MYFKGVTKIRDETEWDGTILPTKIQDNIQDTGQRNELANEIIATNCTKK